MIDKRESYLNQKVINILMVLSIVIIAFLTYKDILGYFFTATDSLTLIDTSRVHSLKDLAKIFTEPLMSGSEFVKIVKYYRPITSLSYSLDYAIWNLNPFGYHLTDLILHILVSISVFFLIRILTNGDQVTAWLSAIIFTTHPILVESVPATARRHDIIVALFLILSLLLFLKYILETSQKRGFLLFSLFFYLLAFGTKEIAIILPFLIFIYLMIFSYTINKTLKSFKDKAVHALKKCLPYLVVTIIYLVWRIYVLQGMGGKRTFKATHSTINSVVNYIVRMYSVDLVFSVSFILLFLFVILLFFRQAILKILLNNDGKILKNIKILLLTIIILSLIVYLDYSLISPFVNHVIKEAYFGRGLKFLTNAMESRHVLPAKFYFYRAKELILGLLSFLLFFSTVCLIVIHQINKKKRFIIDSQSRRLVYFLLIWLFLPLGICIMTLNFSHRSMYISVIPFCAILSIIIIGSLRSLIQKIKEYHSSNRPSRSSLIRSFIINFTMFIITAVLSISLLSSSPLIRKYRGWAESGMTSAMFLDELSKIVTKLPHNAILNIYYYPAAINSNEDDSYHVKSVFPLDHYSIKSWLDLVYPNNNMKVILHRRVKYRFYPDDLDLEIKMKKDNNVAIFVKPKWNPNPFFLR